MNFFKRPTIIESPLGINNKIRTFSKIICLFSFLILLACSSEEVEKKEYNVLFLVSDDMNDWIGCLEGHPDAITPNIDRLAKRSMLFQNAYCPAPICNPTLKSLVSILSTSLTSRSESIIY